MSSQTTDPAAAGALVVQESDVRHAPAKRDRLMHAMAAAEDVLGALQGDMPSSVDLCPDGHGGYEVKLHCALFDLVREFAAHYGVTVTTAEHPGTEGAHYTEADATVRGIAVHAWALSGLPASTPAVATLAEAHGGAQ